MNKTFYIGIDPDLDRSGVAIFEKDNKILVLKNLSFWQLFDLLKEHNEKIIIVRIEAGWLNKKSNWHTEYGQTKTKGESIARNVGENHAVAKLIVQMCIYLELKYEIIQPRAHKTDATLFRAITKYDGKTNQDNRDAAMLLFDKIVE
jgi:hypothetical protein